MRYQAVFFDLDGVLIDSGADIALAVNAALSRFGYKELPEKLIVCFVGNGSRILLENSLKEYGSLPHNFEEIFSWFMQYYQSHPVQLTQLYTGVFDLLSSLAQKNIPVALVSNKPLSVTKGVIEYFQIMHFFDAIICPELLSKIKPDPEGLSLAASIIEKKRNIKLRPQNILMVGDSATDIQAGRRFGCKTCAVIEGLGNREKLLAEKADIVVKFAGDLIFTL